MSTSTPGPETGQASPPIELLLAIAEHHVPPNKTDISAGVGVVVNASRLVLPGDVSALYGWSLRETTGAAIASVRLHDGKDATTELLASIGIASGGCSILAPGRPCVRVQTGRVFLEVIAGSVDGVIYWK